MHIVRGPDGEILSHHRRLGHAFDVLWARGESTFVLESEDWEVIVYLDADGAVFRRLGGPDNG